MARFCHPVRISYNLFTCNFLQLFELVSKHKFLGNLTLNFILKLGMLFMFDMRFLPVLFVCSSNEILGVPNVKVKQTMLAKSSLQQQC